MHKTTLYIPEDDIKALKRLALETPKKGLTHHIRQAILEYLERRRSRGKKFATLRKYMGTIPRSRFGDGVEYQRQLRDEWED